ncbi:MAG: PqqD family protein [Patescibacteria group bacterium]
MNYTITKGLITQKLDNKTVIFDGEESVLYTFNETASYIFLKLKAKWDGKKIILALMKKYGVKEDQAKRDVKELVKDLLKKKIIKRV